MPRALRENGSTTVSIAVFTSTLLLLGHLVTTMLRLETKVMTAWFITVSLLYPLQGILAEKRRCSGHWLVQYSAMAAYYLPTLLTFYAANAVYSTSNSCEYNPGLTAAAESLLCFAVYYSSRLGAIVTHMRVYSLRDGPRDRWRFLQWVVFLGCIEWKWWSRIPSKNRGFMATLFENISPHFFVALFILFGKPPESTLDCQTKAVADYMKRESSKSSSTSSSPFFDDDDDDDGANSNSSLQLLDCCRYPFVQGKNGEWITVKDLVQRDDMPNEDKDTWLSYSLSRLLARRYYGFYCAEEGDDKVRRFALDNLARTNNGYKRAFTIVEVQLAFLHDYFFTTSLQMIELQDIRTYSFELHDTLLPWGAILSLMAGGAGPYDTALARIQNIVMQASVSFMITRLQLYLLIKPDRIPLPIYWTPIHIAFRQVNHLKPINCSRPNEQDVHPVETQTTSVYWSNQIAQYSILHDYDRRRPWRKAFVAWFQGHVLSQPSYSFIKHLPIQEEDVRVRDSVRKLVADTLKAIDGLPTNGSRSLKINRDSAGYDWSWTCRQQTHTHTILVWHIATCYCEMSPPHSYRPEGFPRLVQIDTSYEVAMALSRYCAYLVAFLPEFLPEHSLTTKQVFQNVILDAQRVLGSTHMEEKEKHTKFRDLRLPPRRTQTTFHKGVRLGRQLEKLRNTLLRWKVIAEFWAETILYIAPSDNVEAHIEHLAKGGEFVTHLWAMLSNAGILKRATGEWHPPPASTTTEGPPTKIETTKAPTQAISMVPSNDEAPAPSMFLPPRQTSAPPTNEKGKQLLEDHGQLQEDAGKLYSGEKEFENAKPAYQYKKGNDLMATKGEIKDLPTYMGKLHEYYISDTRAGVGGFEVVVPSGLVFNKEEEKHYVGYEVLFQLFQRRDLDTQILMLWTLFEAKHCLEKRLDHIAFLDPMQVNEKTCRGDDGCDVKDLIDRLTTIFFKIKNKSNILLAYNCEFHFVLVDIKLAESRIEVWDSKRRDLSQIKHLLTVLNNVKENMDGDKMIQLQVHYMQMQTLEQPMASNECGFYVMWAMHQYLGGSTREGNEMREKLQIQKLLDFEIRGFQDELAAFILEEVLSKRGSFSIAKSKNRKDYEKSMFERLL